MKSRNGGSHRSSPSTYRKTTPLGVELLEARWMNAADAIESGLQLVVSSRPPSEAETQLTGALVSGNQSLAASNAAPSVVTPLALLGGNVVRTRVVNASVLGADDAGESSLTYQWSVVRSPSNVAVGFARNGTNQAKSNALTLSRAGEYEVRVTITDQGRLNTSTSLRFTVLPVLSTLRVTASNGSPVTSNSTVSTSSTSTAFRLTALDQFGQSMSSVPAASWTLISGPNAGTLRSTTNSLSSSLAFNTAGLYTVRGTVGNQSLQFSIRVNPAPSSVSVLNTSGTEIPDASISNVSGSRTSFAIRVRDQFGNVMTALPSTTWSTRTAPSGGIARVSMSGSNANVDFTRAGDYELLLNSGGKTRSVKVKVAQTLTSLQVTPGTVSLSSGSTQQFQVRGLDQFGIAMSAIPLVSWTATGGTVSSTGLFTAGGAAGNASIQAAAGALSASANITISPSTDQPIQFQSASVRELIQTYYVDQSINRTEMMQILRSTGADSVVDASELADLRSLVSSNYYVMPRYVRELARDVVFENRANLQFQGRAAGNLVAGSGSSLLQTLVDKWFLGADVPAILGSGISYTLSSGNLFNGTPSLSQAKQGQVGDCYLIASLVSIANKNSQAIYDMFLDNGDGTFTVRFFAPGTQGGARVADFVTVNRRLPTYASGALAYSGYGLSATSSSTTLWIALAEKAYAQWNETGNAGRNGSNTYAGIEGGWMHNPNAQILGTSSTNYSFSSTPQQTLVTAIQSGLAVTAGTLSTVNVSGLVGGHAYTIASYNASNSTFSLHNPWGFQHPVPLTWSQLVGNFSMFTTTSPQGSATGFASGSGFASPQASGTSDVFVAAPFVTIGNPSPGGESSRPIDEPWQDLSDTLASHQQTGGEFDSVASVNEWVDEHDVAEATSGRREENAPQLASQVLCELAMIELYLI